MSFQPVRASDAEREQAMLALRDHYAAGRLGDEELEERLALVARARDRAELRRALAGLPGNRRARTARAAARWDRALLRAHAGSWLTVGAALTAVWALTGAGAFWPAVVIVPWGVLLGGHLYGSRAARRAFRRLGGGDPPARRRLPR
jgi:hypothetical protein